MMDNFKELLAQECDYIMPDNVLKHFLELMVPVKIKAGEALIYGGSKDNNIYFVKEGIMCYRYFDGAKERTHVFAMPGTMMISWHSYYMNLPSFYHVEACCDSVCLRLSKNNFDTLIDQYHAFAKWISRMLFCQMYFFEMKASVIQGSAKERFLSLIKNRPEIMGKVQLKIIAEYLGITQSYLSRLKKDLKKSH